MKNAWNKGSKVVYIDECMFTRASVPKSEWCLRNRNLTISDKKLHAPTLALLAGISFEEGLELCKVYKKSVNIPKFKDYLQSLRKANKNKKLTIFMDNLSTHRSEEAKEEMRQQKIEWIFNVAYSPDFNPIESVFSKIKHKFKALRVKKMVGLLQQDIEKIVDMATKTVTKEDVKNCI